MCPSDGVFLEKTETKKPVGVQVEKATGCCNDDYLKTTVKSGAHRPLLTIIAADYDAHLSISGFRVQLEPS